MIPTYYPAKSAFYLEHEYEMRRERRPYYSYRAFARDLNVSPSTLNEFLKGKTGFSRGRAEKVAERIGLDKSHREHFCDLVDLEYHKSSKQKAFLRTRVQTRASSDTSRLALEHFAMMSDWYHLAALEFLELDPSLSMKELAKICKIPVRKMSQALERMLHLGLLRKSEQGLTPQDSQTLVGLETPSEAIRIFHRQILGLAEKAIFEQDMSRRNLSSTFFSLRLEDLPTVRKELKDAVFKILTRYASKDQKDAVYMLSYQLFQAGELTRVNDGENL